MLRAFRRQLLFSLPRATLRALAWRHGGVPLSGPHWCGCWLGASPIAPSLLRDQICSDVAAVRRYVGECLAVEPDHRVTLLLLCGELDGLRRISGWLHSRYADLTNAVGYFDAASRSIVASYCGDWPEFRNTLCHELCHAFCHFDAGSPIAAPWADEGYVCLVAKRIALHKSWAFRTQDPIPLSEIVSAGQLPMVFPHTQEFVLGAAWLVKFLDAARAERPAAWSIVQRAIRGELAPGPPTIAELERVFGKPIQELDRDLDAFVLRHAADYPIRKRSPG